LRPGTPVPPRPSSPTRTRVLLVSAVALGVAVGLGAYTFGYAKGYSYLTNDPAACANCHIMKEHFDAWSKSSHREVATCNDCHTPHTLVGKYVAKARNGFWHSFYFTTGRFPDPLRITEGNRRITEAACRDCHAAITDAIDPGATAHGSNGAGDASARQLSCVRCHEYVGHWVR
jgi:cytochrome c nitrite reductase small subunit